MFSLFLFILSFFSVSYVIYRVHSRNNQSHAYTHTCIHTVVTLSLSIFPFYSSFDAWADVRHFIYTYDNDHAMHERYVFCDVKCRVAKRIVVIVCVSYIYSTLRSFILILFQFFFEMKGT